MGFALGKQVVYIVLDIFCCSVGPCVDCKGSGTHFCQFGLYRAKARNWGFELNPLIGVFYGLRQHPPDWRLEQAAASFIRPTFKEFKAILKPCPLSESMLSTGISVSLKKTCRVEEEVIPSLFSSSPKLTPFGLPLVVVQ